MDEFAGRVAVVTGSTSGIGEAIARRLAGLGATVVVNSARSVEAGQRLAEALGAGATYVQADIGEPAACRRLVDETVARHGRLDILVNNAGWTRPVDHADLDALDDETFERTFRVNVTGTWTLTRAAMKHLKASDAGQVLNVTSVAGLRPVGSSVAYAMSKAALNHMTHLLAKACAPVRVNAIAPGLVATPWTRDWQAQHETVRTTAPLRRSATPEDCAEAALGLLRSRYVTGAILVVDGGLTLVR
jgi:ketoreductase RED2